MVVKSGLFTGRFFIEQCRYYCMSIDVAQTVNYENRVEYAWRLLFSVWGM